MKVYLRLCFFCYQDGENVEATHYYSPQPEETYDLCPKHARDCEEAKFNVLKLNEEDTTREVDELEYPIPEPRKWEEE